MTPSPGPYEKPPPGIKPVTTTLADVLALFRSGLGKPTQKIVAQREAGTISDSGLSGTYGYIAHGDDHVESRQLGPMLTRAGDFDGQEWEMNENGYVRLISGVHQSDEASEAAVTQSLTGGSTQYLKLLGEVDTPVSAYVIDVNPRGGRHQWYFIERTTGRLVRVESASVDARLVETFDDFRTTGGVVTAWHWHESDGEATNDTDEHTTSLQYNVPVDSRELSIPTSAPSIVSFPQGMTSVRLPARMDGDKIIVRVTINGRGLDFALDSGSDAIVIDRDVVQQLGLATFGKRTASVAGTFEASNAVVPTMQIGDLTLHNAVVQSLPFYSYPGDYTKIVGLLGYDFLAGIVAKVNYQNGTVDAIDPNAFVHPSGDTFEISAALDDEVPMVQAVVGNGIGDYFAVDTGSPFVMIFSAFADAHPDDLQILTFGSKRSQYLFLIETQGVGGDVFLLPTVTKVFHFGGVAFNKFLVMQVLAAPSFQGEDTDGLIGYEFLQYFTVYFDYNESLLILQPNSLLNKKQ
jgi:hypothetical protein